MFEDSPVFGSEAGEYRRAPEAIKALGLAQEIDRPGGETGYEVPGSFNDAIGATPVSRLNSIVNTLLDDRKGIGEKAGRLLTGARTQRVDQRRARINLLEKWLDQQVSTGAVAEYKNYSERHEDAPQKVKDAIRLLRKLKQQAKKDRAK